MLTWKKSDDPAQFGWTKLSVYKKIKLDSLLEAYKHLSNVYKPTSWLNFDLKHFSGSMRDYYHHFSCSLWLLPPNKVVLVTLHNLSGPLAAFSPPLTCSCCCFSEFNTGRYDGQETKHRAQHVKLWNHWLAFSIAGVKVAICVVSLFLRLPPAADLTRYCTGTHWWRIGGCVARHLG